MKNLVSADQRLVGKAHRTSRWLAWESRSFCGVHLLGGARLTLGTALWQFRRIVLPCLSSFAVVLQVQTTTRVRSTAWFNTRASGTCLRTRNEHYSCDNLPGPSSLFLLFLRSRERGGIVRVKRRLNNFPLLQDAGLPIFRQDTPSHGRRSL